MRVRITEPDFEDSAVLQQMAQLLIDGFAHLIPHPYPLLPRAMEEVFEAKAHDRINLLALNLDERVVGWIGAIREYRGNVWEMHPLVVMPAFRRQKIGTMLVEALEQRVADHGGLTLMLGADDIGGQTTIGGTNLYPEPLKHLAAVRNVKNHPIDFYKKLGFVVTGVVPDANGLGNPDILFAKRVRRIR